MTKHVAFLHWDCAKCLRSWVFGGWRQDGVTVLWSKVPRGCQTITFASHFVVASHFRLHVFLTWTDPFSPPVTPSLCARHHRPPLHPRLPLSFHLHHADPPTLPVCHPLLTWTVIQHQMCCGGLCVFRFKVLISAEWCIIMWKFPSKRVDYVITPSLLGLYGTVFLEALASQLQPSWAFIKHWANRHVVPCPRATTHFAL